MGDLPDFTNYSFIEAAETLTTYISEQSPYVYSTDILKKLCENPTISDKRYVVNDKAWVVLGSVKVEDEGSLIVMGEITVIEE